MTKPVRLLTYTARNRHSGNSPFSARPPPDKFAGTSAHGTSVSVTPPTLSRSTDGRRIAFNGTAGQTLNISTVDINGGAVRQLTFDEELMGFPRSMKVPGDVAQTV